MISKISPCEDDDDISAEKSSIYSKAHEGSGIIVDERLAQTAKTLRTLIDGVKIPTTESCSWSHTLFGCVLLADISGFTRLSTTLSVEQLKHHINSFFTFLLSTVKRFGGDAVKFCGDAVIIIWTAPLNASTDEKTRLALTSTNCGLAVIEACGSYDKGTPSKPISLRLHCGLSAGPLHCMCLGDYNRMEFLVSGAQLRAMGVAAGDAKMGELCVTSDIYDLLPNRFSTTLTANENYLVLGDPLRRRSSIITPNRRSLKSVASAVQSALSLKRGEGAWGSQRSIFSLKQNSMYSIADSCVDDLEIMSVDDAEDSDILDKDMLTPFVHECSRRSIQLQATEFLAEIRCVITIFIELINLNADFDSGSCDRPQIAMMSVLNVLRALGGSLRQYVVDDKGCVVICSFGVPGFSYDNNELRAIFAAMGIRDALQEHGITCRIGIASGNAYCGYVGSRDRKEYCVMGSSVNLAARLMGKASVLDILVGESVHAAVAHVMEFTAMAPVNAKGYDHPIDVFSVNRREMSLDNMLRSSQTSMTVLSKLLCRSAEMSSLRSHLNAHNSVTAFTKIPNNAFATLHHRNRQLIVAPEGFGKSLMIQHLVMEESALLADACIANCHLDDIDEAYSTMFGIFRQIFNIQQTSLRAGTSNYEDEVRDFEFEDIDEHEGYLDVINHLRTYAVSQEICDDHIYVHETTPLGFAVTARSRSASVSSVNDVIDESLLCSIVSVPDYDARRMYAERNAGSLYSVLDAVNMISVCVVHSQSDAPASYAIARTMTIVRYAMAHILRTAIENRKCPVFILEDLHWCDEASFDILQLMLQSLQHAYFIGSMRPSNTMMAGRYSRAESMLSLADAKSYLEKLNSLCDVIRIQPFTELQIRVVVESLIDSVHEAQLRSLFDEKCINTIYRHSKGIPGAVFEIALKVKRSVIAKSSSNQMAADHDVDTNVVHILDSLSLESQMVLKIAAVCGTKFSVEIVRKVLEQMECTDMLVNVINSVMDIKRNHFVRRCVPMWEAPPRAILRTWSNKNNLLSTISDGGKSLKSVAKAIKTLVSVHSEARSQSVRDANCYAFTNKRIREGVYAVMLADQQKHMHSVIASVVECEYIGEGVKSDTQIPILKFVAFHYSRADNIEKDVYYSDLVANRLFEASFLDEAMQYYHHLVEVATGQMSMAAIVRYVTNSNSQSRRRSRSIADNSSTQRVMSFRQTPTGEDLSKHYLPNSIFVKELESKCFVIANAQLKEYLLYMSVIEFRQGNFVSSDTYFKLARKVRMPRYCTHNACIVPKQICISVAAIFESVAAQADLFLMRGDVDGANKMTSQLSSLSVTCLLTRVKISALCTTVAMLCGKCHEKQLQNLLALTNNCSEFSNDKLGYVNFHRGVQALVRGEMKTAKVFLSNIARSDASELLFMSSKHLLAWVYFFCGRIGEALRTIEAARRCVLNDSIVYDIWELELRVVVALMSGDFVAASGMLHDMMCKQQGRLGVMYYKTLSAVAGTLQAVTTSIDLGDMKCHMQNLTIANEFMAKRDHCGPVSITCIFLCAYASIMLVQQTLVIRDETESRCRFVESLDKVIQHLKTTTKSIPCVEILVECLLLKVTPNTVSLKQCFSRWKSSCKIRKIIVSHEKGNGTCNANYQFVFGCAFWRLEVCRAYNITSISKISTSELEVFDRTWRCASKQFLRYNTNRNHPFLMFLVNREAVDTTDDVA